MERREHQAGPNQKYVVFVSDDRGYGLDPGDLFESAAADAAAEAEHGWHIGAATLMPMRQMGTAGNIFFQSGGQFMTQAALAVVYVRDAASG
ncbi:MAG TPA: hypothetical protein VH720_03250 [Candidatus Limnocylindrales bacterium]|jgi:hypothetical protein